MNRISTEAVADVLRARLGGRARWLALAGAVAMAVGSMSPWARFAGFPGKMSLSGFPGGARLFCLLLAAGPLLAFANLTGRRRAALAGAVGSVAVVLVNVVAIANEGGAPTKVAWGAWLSLAGSVVAFAGLAALPEVEAVTEADAEAEAGEAGEQVAGGGRLWGGGRVATVAVNLVALFLAMVAVLMAVVWALAIDEPSRFVSFLAFAGAVGAAAQRLGLFDWLASAVDRHPRATGALALFTAAVFPFTQQGDAYWLRVFASIGVFAIAAIGLNVVVGLAGLLDLGYIAFFGVGAYVGAMFANAGLTTVHIHLPFVAVVFLGGCVAAVFGVVIGTPTLRLRGDYLAIVTLGFGEIFRITANNWDGLTRGPNGISGIPDLHLGGFDFGAPHQVFGVELPGFANYYFVELALLAGAIVVFGRLNDSRIGRAWVAIREDEVAAAASGVDTIRLKLLAFGIGAFLAGAAGTVNAHVTTQVSPDSYTFLESILLVAAVVLGGMGTVPGALLGSAALFVIPEKLRAFQDKRLLLFGAALVLMMRFRPQGLVPSKRRRRESRAEVPEAVSR